MNVHNYFACNTGNGLQGGTINIAGGYHEHHIAPSEADTPSGKHVITHEKELTSHSETEPDPVVWYSFGYDAGSLYRSEVGMLRSLLWQLLKDEEELLAAFGGPGEAWNWDVTLLRAQFRHVLMVVRDRGGRVRVFLDAMDECGEEVACDVVRLFRPENDESGGPMTAADLCFSSRHQPFHEVHRDFAIELEHETDEDIRQYVHARFPEKERTLSPNELQAVKNNLCSRAANCFQWLVFICPKVLKLINMRESFHDVVKAMRQFPVELGKMYAGQLEEISDEDVPRALRLFQWLSLSPRCLSTAEDLCYAVCLEDGKIYDSIEDVTADSPHWCSNFDTFCNRAIDWSGNLVEKVTGVLCGNHRLEQATSDALVFDHHSVQEFMVHSGLELLHDRTQTRLQDFSLASMRLQLAGRCLSYLKCKEVIAFRWSRVQLREHVGHGLYMLAKQISQPLDAPPFALTAALEWSSHFRIAEQDSTRVLEILEMLDTPDPDFFSHLRTMRQLAKALDGTCTTNLAESTLLHILADGDLINTFIQIYRPALDATQQTKKKLRSIRKTCDHKLDWRDAQGCTPLSVAAHRQNDTLVRILTEFGVRADIPDIHGWTPLHYAAASGAVDVIEIMSVCGDVDVDARDVGGLTALAVAVRLNDGVENDRLATVKLLMEKSKLGVHNREANHLTLYRGTYDYREMPEECRNAFIQALKDSCPASSPRTGFDRSCVPCMTQQIDKGDDCFLLFNAWLTGLNTPLMHAAFLGSKELVTLLLDCDKIEGSLQGYYGASALQWLVGFNIRGGKYQSGNVAALIESEKLAVDARDDEGNSPLGAACGMGNTDAVRELLSTGEVAVHSRNAFGYTIFEQAIEGASAEVVKMLIPSGLEVEQKCTDGTTFLALAAELGHEAIVTVLLATRKFQVRTGDICGRTPLLLAVRGGHVEVVELLIDAARRAATASAATIDNELNLFRFPIRGGDVVIRFRGDHTKSVAFMEAATTGVSNVAVRLIISGLYPPPVACLMIAIDRGHLDMVKVLLLGLGLNSGHRATVNCLLWPHYREDYGQGTRGEWPSCPLVIAGRHYASPSLCESWDQVIDRERILRHLLKYVCVVYTVENREEAY
ncbi:hypothetical protein LTR22_018137 [Elasticomyces elasticus]|nr:hypothetical protein LTR22_018137 [Elasticomyces elasticus]KAK5752268.1 hypothetical protein LTS12_017662 [Elasticomyces elasticus]